MNATRRRVVWSPEAEQDLLDIWNYVSGDAGRSTADRIVANIHAAANALGEWPQLGSSRDHVREGLRARRVEDHVAFYRVAPAGVDIVRVLHERRDVDAVFAVEA